MSSDCSGDGVVLDNVYFLVLITMPLLSRRLASGEVYENSAIFATYLEVSKYLKTSGKNKNKNTRPLKSIGKPKVKKL